MRRAKTFREEQTLRPVEQETAIAFIGSKRCLEILSNRQNTAIAHSPFIELEADLLPQFQKASQGYFAASGPFKNCRRYRRKTFSKTRTAVSWVAQFSRTAKGIGID